MNRVMHVSMQSLITKKSVNQLIGFTTKINAVEAVNHISMCFFNKLVPFLSGSPGIGKSDIFKQIAAKYKLKLIDIRLSQCDPTDLSGFPMHNGKKASYMPMDMFPLENDPVPDGYEGWLILLDELPSAALAVQAASYKFMLDRMVGQHLLHPKAVIGAAGNLMTDGAIVNRMGTAMQSRLVHYTLTVNWELWSLWASSNKLATEVISYINHRPANLHVFDPNHNDRTFACPRTWEYASRVMLFKRMTLAEKYPSLVGCLGEGVAHELHLPASPGISGVHTQGCYPAYSGPPYQQKRSRLAHSQCPSLSLNHFHFKENTMYEIRQIINPTTKESVHVTRKPSIRLALDELKRQRVNNPGNEYYMTLSSIVEVNNQELKAGIEQWPTITKLQ